MIIKEPGQNYSVLSRFALAGRNEVALSKGFAFLIGKERDALFVFLKNLGIRTKNTENNFRAIKIEIEKKGRLGRTDIEVKLPGQFHLIIECKINQGKVREQRTKYLNDFDPNCPNKYLCFITQERDSTKQFVQNVEVIYRGWMEIIDLFTNRSMLAKTLIKEFSSFAIHTYNMSAQKEVLIQDVSNPKEIKRFKEHFMYRRNETFGIPLYFAPHFTRNAKQPEGEGISYFSKVLGTITMKPSEIDNLRTELSKFTSNHDLIEAWVRGVHEDDEDYAYTYYFLAEPVQLNNPLRKDPGIETGRGKNWIAAAIPPNRCVSFEEFTKRIIQSYN
jgi:hypothetical protein